MSEMKTFVMALSFQNSKYIEVGLDHISLADMKERAFKALKEGDILECENISFRCADVCFIAFYERKANEPSTISEEKINGDNSGSESK